MAITQDLISGLILGSYLGIATVGFTLMFGIMNLLNIAYGEYITFGGYVAWFLIATQDFSTLLAAPIVIGISAVYSLVLGYVFFRPMRDTGPIPLLLTSIGLAFFIRNAYRFFLGTELRFLQYEQPEVFRFEILGGFYINTKQIFLIGSAVVVFVLIHILLTRTKSGIAMRATSSNEDLALITGIDTDSVRNKVWLLAGGLAGFTGLLLTSQRAIQPTTGFDLLLFMITAAVLGGVGSAYGAIAGAFFIGIFISLAVSFLPTGTSQLASVIAFVGLIIVLLIRPQGIANVEVVE